MVGPHPQPLSPQSRGRGARLKRSWTIFPRKAGEGRRGRRGERPGPLARQPWGGTGAIAGRSRGGRIRDAGSVFGHVSGVVAASDEGAAGDFLESHFSGELAEFVEFFGGDVANDREVFVAGLQVLAEGEVVDAVFAEVGEGIEEFLTLFPESEHEAAFGFHRRVEFLDVSHHPEGPAVVTFRAADSAVEPWDGFHVVVEDIGPGFDDAGERRLALHEVGGQDFGRGPGPFSDGDDTAIEMVGPAIRQVVAGDAGDDDVFQPESCGGFGEPLRFVLGRWRGGSAAVDGAEAAGSGADVPEDHERRRQLAVALHPVGAFRVIADGLEAEFLHQSVGEVVRVAVGDRPFEPAGQAAAAADGGSGRDLGFGNDGQTESHSDRFRGVGGHARFFGGRVRPDPSAWGGENGIANRRRERPVL